jgi:hypothetical protein
MTDVMRISDDRLRAFLDALDETDDVEVSDFEAEFMESNVNRRMFTEAQRCNVLAKMIEKHGHKVDW